MTLTEEYDVNASVYLGIPGHEEKLEPTFGIFGEYTLDDSLWEARNLLEVLEEIITNDSSLAFNQKDWIKSLKHRQVWLFWQGIPKDYLKRSREIYIRYFDENLTVGDYLLLMFISYQDEETRDAVQDLPMDMIYDIYQPLIDSAIDDWRISRKSNNNS
jgi:hypothetical protein